MFARVFKYDLNQKLATEIVPINKKHESVCSISAKQPEKCGKNKKVETLKTKKLLTTTIS